MITKDEVIRHLARLDGVPSPELTELIENSGGGGLTNRHNPDGHLTASAVIVDLYTSKILLLKEKVSAMWLAPGGHLDTGDDTIVDAVLRRIKEDTGIGKSRLIPMNVIDGRPCCVELNSHLVYAGGKRRGTHYHHDLRFVFGYTGRSDIDIDNRINSDYQWIPMDDVYIREMIICKNLDDILFDGIEKYARQEIMEGKGYLSVPLAAYQYDRGCRCLDRGMIPEAEELFLKSIDSYRRTYDDQTETPVQIYNPHVKLAQCCRISNRNKEAVKWYLEAIRVFDEVFRYDEEKQYWYLKLEIYIELAKLYVGTGNRERSFEYYERALEYLREKQVG